MLGSVHHRLTKFCGVFAKPLCCNTVGRPHSAEFIKQGFSSYVQLCQRIISHKRSSRSRKQYLIHHPSSNSSPSSPYYSPSSIYSSASPTQRHYHPPHNALFYPLTSLQRLNPSTTTHPPPSPTTPKNAPTSSKPPLTSVSGPSFPSALLSSSKGSPPS